jgi:hypothetical protein
MEHKGKKGQGTNEHSCARWAGEERDGMMAAEDSSRCGKG